MQFKILHNFSSVFMVIDLLRFKLVMVYGLKLCLYIRVYVVTFRSCIVFSLANDKAKYMPTLLLHTAQSFNAIKDTKNYNKFLDSLISNYPTSKEAQNAKKLKEKKDKK